MDLFTFIVIIMAMIGAWSLYAINSLHYVTFKYEIDFSDLTKFLEKFPSWFDSLAVSSHNTFKSSASNREKMNAAQFSRFLLSLAYLVLSYFLIQKTPMSTDFVLFIVATCVQILGLIVGWRFGHSLIKETTESSD